MANYDGSNPVEASGIVGKNFPFDLRIEAFHRFEPGNRVELALARQDHVCRSKVSALSSAAAPGCISPPGDPDLIFSIGYYITFKPAGFLRVRILGDLCTELLNVLVGTVVFKRS